MSEQTLSLPAAISSAIEHYEQVKTSYLEIRERLVSLASRIEKHRKTASAASEESTLAGNTWRRQFRESDGVLSKEIRELKRKELDTRELAEEYTNLASELQPEFELCQLDTADARKRCDDAREAAKTDYVNHSIQQAGAELFATSNAQGLIDALERKGLVETAVNQRASQERQSPDYISELTAAKNARLLNLGKIIQQLIIDARKEVAATPDPTWQALEPISKLSIEALPTELNGPVSINRRRTELSTQLSAAAAS